MAPALPVRLDTISAFISASGRRGFEAGFGGGGGVDFIGVGEEDLVGAVGFEVLVALDAFAGNPGFPFFADSSCTWLDILEAGGGGGAAFGGAGGVDFWACFDGAGGVFAEGFDVADELATGFEAFGGAAGFAGAGSTAFGAAFVDFERVVVLFASSGTSAAIGSDMTFFGLPRFLATSEDILGSIESVRRCKKLDKVFANFLVACSDSGCSAFFDVFP